MPYITIPYILSERYTQWQKSLLKIGGGGNIFMEHPPRKTHPPPNRVHELLLPLLFVYNDDMTLMS